MENKRKIIVIVVCILSFLLVGLIVYKKLSSNDMKSFSTVDNIDVNVDKDTSDEEIDWSKYEEEQVSFKDGLIIDKAGVFEFTGNINGTIKVNAPDCDVKIILNNVSIISSNGPAILVEEANNTIISLIGENYIEDSLNYSLDDDINATIFSKDDLILEGDGSLEVKANYSDGIVSKDDLKFNSGTYVIDSVDDAIRGKNAVYILDGKFNITSSGDGIKSTEADDNTKGYILIENGDFNIESELDGLQAESKLIINNGIFKISTGGGSTNVSTSENWGNWGKPGYGYNPSVSNDTLSAKAIKAVSNLVINNGIFEIDSSDDSIHSNAYVGIKDGTFDINSGDDGIHADTELIIDGGNINIKKSYEGLESAKMTINGGQAELVASDDGINIAGGNDSSAMNRPGANNYSSNSDNILVINGGDIKVSAVGDGIDVNGSAYIYSGNVFVSGPTDNGNGVLDYDKEFVVDGGKLVATGSSGMAQGISSSKQYGVVIYFTSNYNVGTKIAISDSDGDEVISTTLEKSSTMLIVSSSDFEKNKTYTITIDGSKYTTFKTSSYITTVGNSGNMGIGGQPGGGPGRPGR
ncbi:MAG: carbohydrate-binding domain-containing protein [Bacilli bacterium]|nr:carbohydrate-binding domain-containing protein [Bacilli bacterium]